MPKIARYLIKEDEKRILYELLKDSNQSVNIIAKKLGFSRQKVWRIVNQFKEKKAIWGYTAIINEEMIEQKSYVILIRKTTEILNENLAMKIIKRTIEPAAKKLNVIIDSSFYTNGIYDWVICFSAKDLVKAKQFCDVVLEAYSGYIADLFLLENLFWIKKHGILNPEKHKLKEFL